MEEPAPETPVPRSRLSKTPSWITLGFVLGVLFVLSLPEKPKRQPVQPPEPEPPVVHLERPKLTDIEAVFAEWGEWAVWENDVTQVALWDSEKHSYSIFFEVLRSGEDYYFRSIPRLTRPLLTRGIDPDSPLQFTETERTRREWIERGQYTPRSEIQGRPGEYRAP